MNNNPDDFSPQNSKSLEDKTDNSNTTKIDSKKRKTNDFNDLILNELPLRAAKANDLLKSKLKGKIAIKVSGEKFSFDWTSAQVTVKSGTLEACDTEIEISSQDLMRISSGLVNPQIAMLSERIKVKGNPEFAIYLFNLIAP